MISSSSTIVASKDQVSCDLAGEAAILNLKNGTYYGLDEIGASVWNLIQQPKSVTQLCEAITREYDVDTVRCQNDLIALFTAMEAQGLIELCDAVV